MSDIRKDMGNFVVIDIPLHTPIPYCTGERIKIYTECAYPILQTEIRYNDGEWSRFGSPFSIPGDTLPQVVAALQQSFPHLFTPARVKEKDNE